ncbi:VWA domain-containing protein [Litoribrevibacter euphylliae]|uniref:VWA domain-containing protein n=1 Tax=Litoribrevibacter euphylliae TaxID=1834034 RepID=A0ABV7HKK3_9GAMM
MTFAWPLALLLLPLPLLFWRYQKTVEDNTQAPIYVPGASQWQLGNAQVSGRVSSAAQAKWIMIFMIASWICFIVALARPQWVGDPIPLPAQGHDLLLAVDLSGSMDLEDMVYQNKRLNRLNTVKLVVRDFLKERQGDRVGLVVFGDAAFIHTPVTRDLESVSKLLMEAQVEMAGPNTAIGDAIIKSTDVLRDQPEEARIMVLLTDGANTAGEIQPLPAAEIAAKNGIKIYTIGIGADSMTRSSLFGLFNNTVNPSKDLDEKTLKAIAKTTSGLYFRAKNPEQLESIYQKINELEPIDQDEQFIHPVKEWFYWPLAVCFALYLLAFSIKYFDQIAERFNRFTSPQASRDGGNQ